MNWEKKWVELPRWSIRDNRGRRCGSLGEGPAIALSARPKIRHCAFQARAPTRLVLLRRDPARRSVGCIPVSKVLLRSTGSLMESEIVFCRRQVRLHSAFLHFRTLMAAAPPARGLLTARCKPFDIIRIQSGLAGVDPRKAMCFGPFDGGEGANRGALWRHTHCP